DQVEALLRRVARVPDPVVAPALLAGASSEYRGRMDFDWGRDASGAAVLGLHHRADAARIQAIEDCRVLPREANAVRNTLALLARGRGLSTWDARSGRGLLRRATLRTARSTGEVLAVLETGRGDPPELAALVRELQRRHPRIVGVVRRAFDRDGTLVEESILAGRDHLFEEIDGDRYRIPAESFFQPNTAGLALLRRTALELLTPAAGERVLEIYAGVGFFTVSLARSAAEVTAIEGSRAAVGAARDNLAAAGCANVRLVQGDAAVVLPPVLAGERFDAGLVDPPRAGLVPGVLQSLAPTGPPRLVYVSCDPATLARDVGGFVAAGFRLVRAVPIDLFPHTHHLECVVLLERAPAS
ncbi:MAG: 23S rRNA (uracil(1939)-C(5))-methyltransferase RlmD, partial [Candidatus Polarisedimenticolia bacterium]